VVSTHETTDQWLNDLVVELDRYAAVPDDVLWDIVTRDGSCVQLYVSGNEPEWTDERPTDRKLAAKICAGCPARRECLELELRTAGMGTTGVWGALCDEDRRALYPLWLARRQANGGYPLSQPANPADGRLGEAIRGWTE
jgi:WhiB family redox-sensing transcriptional regulator